MTASQRPERVDRDALIEAAAHVLPTFTGPGGALDWEKRETAVEVLDAVLPLIADAITARAEFWGYPGDLALADAARLVRSLGGEQ